MLDVGATAEQHSACSTIVPDCVCRPRHGLQSTTHAPLQNPPCREPTDAKDGKINCFFQAARTFAPRYATFVNDKAKLDKRAVS
jgi:hypothetical protein